MTRQIFYFLRSIETRIGAAGQIVYAVRSSEPHERVNSVPVIGGFPPRWRPLAGVPGIVLATQDQESACIPCEVPRNQFRHFQRIEEAEALQLYPDLAGAFPAGTTGRCPTR